VEIYGAGRTDSGVHARGQVAHLEAPTRLPVEMVRQNMNDLLPFDINILKVEKADSRFHARHHAQQRHYIYEISKRRDAFAKKYVWWVKDRLDILKMQEAAKLYVGFQDFASFGEEKPGEKSTLVELSRCEIRETEDRIFIEISGSHFLWKMVRRMVGLLVEIGRGNEKPEKVTHYLKNYSRDPAKMTAPPSGLFLDHVDY
jgi:tRNA pseudouridine38-40 synthase